MATGTANGRQERAKELRAQGLSTVAIAGKLGVSHETIRVDLRAAGVDTSAWAAPAGKLWLSQAADRFQLNRHKLRAAAEAKRVRARRVDCARGPKWLFDERELAEDLEPLRCGYEGCDRVALGPSGGCEAHGHVFEGARAAGVKRPDIGPKISAAQTGKPHPRRPKYPPEHRWCEWCGKDLGHVRGSMIRDGRGRFCDASHATLWYWTHEPERYPQSAGPGPAEFACALCGGLVERWPSQVAIAAREKRRFVCEVCFPLWRSELMRARRAVRRADPTRRGTAARDAARDAFKRALAIGQRFESQVLSRYRKVGRRPPLALNIAIEAMHARGFTDEQLVQLLHDCLGERRNPRYVERRRHEAGIRRRVSV